MIITGASEVAISTSGHRLVQLKDICERITKGSTPTSYGFKYTTEGIRFIKAENIDKNGLASTTTDYIDEATNEFLKRSILQERDILFSIAGTIGRVGIIRRADLPANTNQALAIVRLQPGIIEQRYLFYYLKSDAIQKDALKRIVGVGRANLSLTNIGEFAIPLISLDKQKQIVAEIEKQFSRLDEAVANLKRVKANLKCYKASVLKSAVEGKLTEDWRKQHPNLEPSSKLLERILAERRLKWSGRGKYKEPSITHTGSLSKLPEGWVWASVEQLSTKAVDGVHKRPDYVLSGIPFVTVRNLTAGPGINLKNLNYVTKEAHEQFIKRADPEEGDILISKDGTLGVVRVVRTKAVFSIFVSVALVKPVLKQMSDFLGIALSSPQVQAQMVPKGSGLQHIHLEDLRADCVPVPSLEEQKEIISEVERRLSVIEELEAAVVANLTRADRLRQSVLARAFSGQLVGATV